MCFMRSAFMMGEIEAVADEKGIDEGPGKEGQE